MRLAAGDIPAGLDKDIVWIDLDCPTREEEIRMEEALSISVPTREDMKDIEPSSRLFIENGDVFMTGSLVWKTESDFPDLTDIAFILTGNRLVTVRYGEPRSFKLFAAALQRGNHLHCAQAGGSGPSGAMILSRLLETIVDRTAEILEQEAARIDALSLQVFSGNGRRRPPHYLENKLIDIASHHRLLSKVRESLASLARLTTFLQAVPAEQADDEARALCHTVSRDIQSLSEHVSFVAGNITFLLDASLGLINVEQNAIIKIFSIASVVFLPPTLVASIYGMNFRFIPETEWSLGYPMSLFAMLASAAVTYYFFRWKGWL
nr:magnesium transporter CorA family protein [uncultured Gellertiella sp.]